MSDVKFSIDLLNWAARMLTEGMGGTLGRAQSRNVAACARAATRARERAHASKAGRAVENVYVPHIGTTYVFYVGAHTGDGHVVMVHQLSSRTWDVFDGTAHIEAGTLKEAKRMFGWDAK